MWLRSLYRLQRRLWRRLFLKRHFVVSPSASNRQIWPRNFAQEAFWVKVVLFLTIVAFLSLIACGLAFIPNFTFMTFLLFLAYVTYIAAEDNSIKLIQKYSGDSKFLQGYCACLVAVRRTKTTHSKENVANSMFVASFAAVLLIPSDSPITGGAKLLPLPYPAIIVLGVVISVFATVRFGSDRLRQENAVRAGDRLRRRDKFATLEAQQKMKKIDAILAEFGSFRNIDWFTSFFVRTCGIAAKEAEIQSMFEYPGTETITLNCLIRICKLETLLIQLKDGAERNSRSMLVDLLCFERVDELDVRSKALLLHAIMTNRISFCSVADAGVGNLILRTRGDELSVLKSMTDAKGSVHSFYKLVFDDVSESTREAVLKHCGREAITQLFMRSFSQNMQLNHLLCTTKTNDLPLDLDFFFDEKNQSYTGKGTTHQWKKILTDMDDTLCCSGGRYPAGIDERYPRHVVYPGVTTFLHAMEENLIEENRREVWWLLPSTSANHVYLKIADEQVISDETHLVGLSARPHIPGDVVEARVFSQFERMQKEHGLRSMPTLLTGALDTGGAFMFTGEPEHLGRRKFETFRQYLTLYREFMFIFVGDNGQADLILALMILDEFPNVIDQVYIHVVQDILQSPGYPRYTALPIELSKKIYFYTDYIDAAIHAATRCHALISFSALWRISVAAVNDFDRITNWVSQKQKFETGEELNISIDRCNKVLQGASITLPAIRHVDCGIDPKLPDLQISTPAPVDAAVQAEESNIDESLVRELAQQQATLEEKSRIFEEEKSKWVSENIDVVKNFGISMQNLNLEVSREVNSLMDRFGNMEPFESCHDLAALDPSGVSSRNESKEGL